MYICICNAVTDKQLLEAQQNSNHSVDQVIKQLGVGSCCGSCLDKAEDLLLNNAGVKTFNPANFATAALTAS
jgi:bacterioferritin-associated ferredoxin